MEKKKKNWVKYKKKTWGVKFRKVKGLAPEMLRQIRHIR